MIRCLPGYFALAVLGLVICLQGPADAAQKKSKVLFVEGKIERIDKDTVILRSSEDKEVTVYVNPRTTYLIGGKTVEFTTLKPGTVVAVEYDLRDNRYEAVRVADVTLLEAEVIRVEKDQVILRGPEKNEVIIYVNPQTRYQLTPSGGTIVDVQPGSRVNVYYNVYERRNLAQRIFVRRK
jgi:hypothetical protein